MNKILTSAGLACLCAAFLTGCGGGGGSSSPAFTPGAGSGLTSTQQSNSSMGTSLTTMIASFAPSMAQANASASLRAHLGGLTVTTVTNGNTTNVTIDYGSGYAAPDGNIYSGAVTIADNSGAQSGSVTFTKFAVNGLTINGAITFTVSPSTTVTGGTNIQVIGNLTDSAGDTIGVNATELVSVSQGVYQITSATLTDATASGTNVTYVTANAVFDPTTKRLDAGTITTTYMSGGSNQTVVLTFNSQTPGTGNATVSVNGAAAANYPLYPAS